MNSTYKPKQFIASPNAEMLGVLAVGMSENLRSEEIKPILEEYGLTEIETDKWYPQQLSLDIAKAIHDGNNGVENLVAMGRGIGQTAILPSQINDVETLIAALPHIYQANLRNIHAEEHFYTEKLGDQHYKFINNTPASNNVIYGMLWELVLRFVETPANVKITPISGFEPQAEGGAVIEIKWTS